MSSQRLQTIPPRQFARQPLKTFPGGYVCLVRDVAYGNRYRLLRLRDPRELKRRLLDYGNFETELAYVWQASRVEAAEDSLRGRLAPGAARDEWFDLDIGQLAQLSKTDVRSQAAPTASKATRSSQPSKAHRQRTAAKSNVISPYQREINHSPAAATQARPNRMRSLATGFIVLLILALLVMPRFKGIPLYGYGDSSANTGIRIPQAARPEAPQLGIELTGETVVVRWSKVAGADSYAYRYRVNSGPFTYYENTQSLRKTLAGLDSGDIVKFELRAIQGNTQSLAAKINLHIPTEATPIQVEVAGESAILPETNDMIVFSPQGQSIHVRACPSTRCAVIGRLPNGSELLALEVVPDAHDNLRSDWVRFAYGDRDGYVFSAVLLAATSYKSSVKLIGQWSLPMTSG